ncbi:MAG TPA: amidohydrolase family protein [Blastocatellia bacterium]|jgi:imidazolonepropionase-like amidohydrolase|nr:amidohydrolase family protein [Blastocatellia bacterium]
MTCNSWQPFSKRPAALVPLCALLLFLFPAQANAGAQAAERGKFLLYDLKQVMGEESYEITPDNGALIIKSTFALPGMEAEKPLAATLRVRRDLTPERFEIAGMKPSNSQADISIEIKGRTASVREGKQAREVAVPARFFTVAGYAPLAIEMMLVRYCVSKGVVRLETLPAGEVTIEHRGRDAVTVGGKQVRLERYGLAGVTWGEQTLWLDSAKRLVAVVNIGYDTENTLPAVLEGYESALPFFLTASANDGVARLTRLADRLSPKHAGALAVVGGTLIDGTGKAPVADSTVIIEGGVVTAVGPSSQVKVPDGATRIDAGGKFVLPGLWDMHAHLFQIEFGPAYLAAGVTTVRDVGNEFEYATRFRDAFNRGRGLGPRMLLAGYINGKNSEHAFDVQVDTPDEARAAVRHYKRAGFEMIKIRDDVKPDSLRAIADEAHRLGMTLTGHVPKNMNAIQAVEAGMDQISHLNFLQSVFVSDGVKTGGSLTAPFDPESPEAKRAIEVFKKHGTVIDPTLSTLELQIRPTNTPITAFEPGMAKVAPQMAEHLNNIGYPPIAAPQIRRAMAQLTRILGALHRAGIPIVAGTDVTIPGHSLHRELELYVKAGFTPMEAIQSATIVPARVMKLDKEVGTVEAGKRADLIIVDGNPLESISNTRKVKTVVANGRAYDCAALWRSVGFQP